MKQHELVPPDLPSEEILCSPGAMCPVYEKGMRHTCMMGLPPPDTGGCKPKFLVFDGGYNSDPEYITCCFMVSISN